MVVDAWTLGTVVAVLTVTLGWLLHRVLRWFSLLNVASAEKASEHYLEDPSSLQKVPAPSLFGDATKSLSIVVPAYNEADRIAPMLDETLEYLQHRRDRKGPHFTYEVIVVDDGSSDDTAKVVFGYVRQHGLDAIRLVQLSANRGKGAAVKAGVLCARGELILFADGDGATVISDVERLEEGVAKVAMAPQQAPGVLSPGKRGFAVGSRAHLQEQAESRRHWIRNFLMHGFHVLVMLVVGGAIRDTQCGFKLMTRSAAQLLLSNTRLQRWCFDVELIYLARELKIPIVEVPVDWTEIPGSKIKATSIVHMAWELLAILIGYKWSNLWSVHVPGNTSARSR